MKNTIKERFVRCARMAGANGWLRQATSFREAWHGLPTGGIALLVVFSLGCRGNSNLSPPRATDPGNLWQFEYSVVDDAPRAGYRLNDVALGDIDGDGLLDIWTTGRGSGSDAYQMFWYQNPSWVRHRIAPGDFKYGNLGDVDGDGDIDVVVDQVWFENLGVWEQNWPRHSLGHDIEPDLVHLVDIDGDSHLDIVMTTKNALYWVRPGENPRSPWEATLIAEQSSRRTGGAVHDIDGDGDLDVVWGNAWYENRIASSESWTAHTIDPQWPAEARSAVADLTGDGKVDVVLSDEEGHRGIMLCVANGTGAASSWTSYPIVEDGYQGVHSLALADFDLDGDLDVFAAEMHTGIPPHKISVFENVDIKNRLWAEHIVSESGSHNARVGDIDMDGRPDIVGKNFEAGAAPLRVELWLNRYSKSSRPWNRHVIDDDRPWRAVFVTSGDIDRDGRVDIVTGGWWYRNPGNIAAEWIRHPIGGDLRNMAAVHDFDSDGDLDILGTAGRIESDQFWWARNDGQGHFAILGGIPRGEGDFLQGTAVGKLANDGPLSVILSWHDATSTQVLELPTPITGPWTWRVLSTVTNGEQVALVDIDGDGDMDVHLGNRWLEQSGDGWRDHSTGGPSIDGSDPDRIVMADIDGDGDLDAVIGCEHAKCVVWLEAPEEPTGPWSEHVVSTDLLGLSLDAGDVDRDGDMDIVVGEHNTDDPFRGRVVLYLGEQMGTAWTERVLDDGLEHHDGTHLVDIDRDGDLDIVSIGWTHAWVVLYENPLQTPGSVDD